MHHLRYVLKLAKCLHFSKAASELSITQPTLSQQIMLLEQELGVKLFERKTRSVSLTKAGEEFVSNADRVIIEFDRLQEAMRKQSETKKGSLRVGTLLNMARLDVNAQAWTFQREHPEIQVTISEMLGSYELLKQLESDVFDVVFCIPSYDMRFDANIKFCSILPGRVVAAVPEEHRLAARRVLMLRELAGENLIFPVKAHSLYSTLLAACRSSGFEPQIVALNSKSDTGVDLSRKGIGIALLSSTFVDESMRAGVSILDVEPEIPRHISLAYSIQNANLSAVELFRDFIRQNHQGAVRCHSFDTPSMV